MVTQVPLSGMVEATSGTRDHPGERCVVRVDNVLAPIADTIIVDLDTDGTDVGFTIEPLDNLTAVLAGEGEEGDDQRADHGGHEHIDDIDVSL